MNIELAKQIYESASEYNLPEDYILDCEGLDKEEYKTALNKYLDTLPSTEITMGWEEPEPDRYLLYEGCYLSDQVTWL